MKLSKKLSLALITISIVQVPARAGKPDTSGWERFVMMSSISGAAVVGTTALGYLWYLYHTPGNTISQEILDEAQAITTDVEDKLAEAPTQTAAPTDTATSEGSSDNHSAAGNSGAAHGSADRVERHMHEHQKQTEKTLKSIEQRCKQMYDDNEGNTY